MTTIIACMSQNRVIGNKSKLPWHFPDDLRHFKETTRGHTIVMGRKTYESVGLLPGRETIVMSRDLHSRISLVDYSSSVIEVLERAGGGPLFVIGGAKVYRAFLPHTNKLMLTIIHKDFEGDTTFPKVTHSHWELTHQQDCSGLVDEVYTKATYIEYERRQ